jgi:hypothetical protein
MTGHPGTRAAPVAAPIRHESESQAHDLAHCCDGRESPRTVGLICAAGRKAQRPRARRSRRPRPGRAHRAARQINHEPEAGRERR